MAFRKDEFAEPVGRGRGEAVLPLPGWPPPEPSPGCPPPKPEGTVTPCFLRHSWKEDACDELEPEELPEPEPELALELHPATASTAAVATTPSTTGLYTHIPPCTRQPRFSRLDRRS
jgi:hypothetical protein